MVANNEKNSSGSDWEDRVLCRDESCTGTINPNGHCRVCGLPLGDGPHGSESSPEQHSFESSEPWTENDGYGVDDGETGSFDNGEAPDSEWEDRILCRDEECIGTIGPDGLCRVCGLAYKDTDG